MKSLTNLVLSLSLAAGIAGCKRDYSFLEQRDAADDITQRYDLGADNRVAADVDGDKKREYDLGRDAPETDGPSADGIVPDTLRLDRYAADVRGDTRRAYDAAAIDAPHADRYSPDAGVMDAARADRPVIVFPDAEIPDLYADGRADMPPDLGADLPADLGADAFNPCPGEAPLNRLQAGVCAGSRNVCGAAGWQEDYSSIVGYEVNEVACDGLDNDCDGLTDILQMIDDFNRPDQDGLGNNALGNPWINYGSTEEVDEWDIRENAAVASMAGNISRPTVSSNIGYRSSFNMYVRFKLSEVNVGPAALLYVVNGIDGVSDDGLALRVATYGPSEHRIYRRGVEVAVGSLELQANTWYNLQFSYNDSVLGVKIWEDGTVKPAGYLMVSEPVPEVEERMQYTKFGGILEAGAALTTTMDYVAEGCE